MFIDSALSRLHAYVEHMTQSAASLHKPVRVPVFCYAAGDRCVGPLVVTFANVLKVDSTALKHDVIMRINQQCQQCHIQADITAR